MGECGFWFWFSIGLFGLAAWRVFAGTMAMLAMFLGASLPMMGRRSLELRLGYSDVTRRVSRFVPRPLRRVSQSDVA